MPSLATRLFFLFSNRTRRDFLRLLLNMTYLVTSIQLILELLRLEMIWFRNGDNQLAADDEQHILSVNSSNMKLMELPHIALLNTQIQGAFRSSIGRRMQCPRFECNWKVCGQVASTGRRDACRSSHSSQLRSVRRVHECAW